MLSHQQLFRGRACRGDTAQGQAGRNPYCLESAGPPTRASADLEKDVRVKSLRLFMMHTEVLIADAVSPPPPWLCDGHRPQPASQHLTHLGSCACMSCLH